MKRYEQNMSEVRSQDIEILKKTVRFFEAVLSASQDGVLITNEDAVVLVANQSFCSLFDCFPGDLIETSLFDWLSAFERDPVSDWLALQNAVYSKGVCSNIEFELMNDAVPQFFSVNASSLTLQTDEERGALAVVSIWRDVTLKKNTEADLERANIMLEQRVAERTEELKLERDNFVNLLTERISSEREKERIAAELVKAKKMEVMGMMAGGVAHDLNNILTGIVGYPELILMKLPEDSTLRKPVEAIRASGRKAATVVADLLTVARGAASTREVRNLNVLIKEYLSSPEYERLKSLYPDIIFRHRLEAEQPVALCSPVHVGKCLMNLAINAAEAIGSGVEGTVVVATLNQYVNAAASTEHSIKKGDYLVLSVRDTGPGIPHTELEHIFEPFYTKKIMGRSGTGLGLTVAWNTMRIMTVKSW